ncbi:MAG: ATP-binding cassette domain-containing protein [Chloroflexota bacterium]|nr:ATP-binding cassette domain-containing protein [Chloroflexota bacterium]
MLTLNNISRHFSDQLLFDNVSLTINRGDRIGLVGPNGAGKSTLLEIIAGTNPPDSGTRTLAPGMHVGYLPQGLFDLKFGSLRNALDAPSGGFFGTLEAINRETDRLSGPDGSADEVIQAWERAQTAFDAAGAYQTLDRLEALLDQFGVPRAALDKPLTQLSGGERTRAGLAALLAMQPDLLLLDEPTNHLDLGGQVWLAGFVRDYDGAVVIVSHDRGFLDDAANRIAALRTGEHDLVTHAGNYSSFVDAQEQQRASEFETYKRQQERIAGLESSIDQNERSACKIEGETIHFHYRKRAQKIARAATVRKARLERMLDSEDLVDKPGQLWGLALDFPEPTSQARDVATLDNIVVKRGNRLILDHVSLTLRYGERVALIGNNGAGKTTLIHVLSGQLEPGAGYRRIGTGVRMGMLAQDQDTLDPGQTVLESIQQLSSASESGHRTELHRFLFGGESAHRQIGDLSWGERTRLMLAHIAIPGADLLLLDEPLNHLDIDARESFEQALTAFPGTVVFVAHDRYAVKRLATRVIRVENGLLVDVHPDTDPEMSSVFA